MSNPFTFLHLIDTASAVGAFALRERAEYKALSGDYRDYPAIAAPEKGAAFLFVSACGNPIKLNNYENRKFLWSGAVSGAWNEDGETQPEGAFSAAGESVWGKWGGRNVL